MQIEELYRLYFNEIYRYLLTISGNESLAEELTGEAFFKAIKNIDSFRGECELRVWLCRIAKNTYFSYLKKEKHTIGLDEVTDFADSSALLEEKVLDKLETERVRNILHTIPEVYKEVFMWRVFAELSFEEIGAIFEKTANWACVTYYRARKMIQKEMEEP